MIQFMAAQRPPNAGSEKILQGSYARHCGTSLEVPRFTHWKKKPVVGDGISRFWSSTAVAAGTVGRRARQNTPRSIAPRFGSGSSGQERTAGLVAWDGNPRRAAIKFRVLEIESSGTRPARSNWETTQSRFFSDRFQAGQLGSFPLPCKVGVKGRFAQRPAHLEA